MSVEFVVSKANLQPGRDDKSLGHALSRYNAGTLHVRTSYSEYYAQIDHPEAPHKTLILQVSRCAHRDSHGTWVPMERHDFWIRKDGLEFTAVDKLGAITLSNFGESWKLYPLTQHIFDWDKMCLVSEAESSPC